MTRLPARGTPPPRVDGSKPDLSLAKKQSARSSERTPQHCMDLTVEAKFNMWLVAWLMLPQHARCKSVWLALPYLTSYTVKKMAFPGASLAIVACMPLVRPLMPSVRSRCCTHCRGPLYWKLLLRLPSCKRHCIEASHKCQRCRRCVRHC